MISNYDIIVFTSFYFPHLGGVERYVENFYKETNRKVLIITSKYDNKLKTREKEKNLEILRVNSIKIIKDKYYIPSIRGIKEIKTTMNKAKKGNIKTQIHTHTRFYFINVIATYLAKKMRLTHYHFEHGSSFVHDGSFLVRGLAYLFDMTLARYVLKNSSSLFPISEGVKTFLNKHYKNLTFGPILYNSFDFREKRFKRKAKPKIPKILFVGRLVKSKGVYELLEAARILKQGNFSFKLSFIGDGSEKVRMEKTIEKYNLEKEIKVRGKLPYEKTQKEYCKHDIFINPSYTEGLPTTVLEALAHSLLIVATDVGGTREIIKKEKLLQKSELTGKNLSKAILYIYINWDMEYNEYWSIYQKVKKKFDIKNTVNKYLVRY